MVRGSYECMRGGEHSVNGGYARSQLIVKDGKAAHGKYAAMEAIIMRVYEREMWAGTPDGDILILSNRDTEGERPACFGFEKGPVIARAYISFVITGSLTRTQGYSIIYGDFVDIVMLDD